MGKKPIRLPIKTNKTVERPLRFAYRCVILAYPGLMWKKVDKCECKI